MDENYSKALFLTNKSKLILLNLKNFQIINTLEDVSNTFWNNFDGYYINNDINKSNNKDINELDSNLNLYSEYNNRVNFALGNRYNFFLSSDFNKNFLVNIHNSTIQSIKIRSDDKIFVTFGYSDKMIAEWRMNKTSNDNINEKHTIELEEQGSNTNTKSSNKNKYDAKIDKNVKEILEKKKKNDIILNNNLDKKIFYYKNLNISHREIKIFDTNLINELSYCFVEIGDKKQENEINNGLTEEYSKLIFTLFF